VFCEGGEVGAEGVSGEHFWVGDVWAVACDAENDEVLWVEAFWVDGGGELFDAFEVTDEGLLAGVGELCGEGFDCGGFDGGEGGHRWMVLHECG